MQPAAWSLVAITDEAAWGDRAPATVIRDAVAGGARAILLRLRAWEPPRVAQLATDVLPFCRAAGVAVIVHQHAAVAAATGAAGVHLTSAQPDVAAARALLEPAQCVGVSCHSAADVQAAEAAGADYVLLGPLFATPSKAAFGPPLGLAVLRAAAAGSRIPIIGVGGIDAGRAAAVRAAGATGIAAIRALFAVPEVAAAARALRRASESPTARAMSDSIDVV